MNTYRVTVTQSITRTHILDVKAESLDDAEAEAIGKIINGECSGEATNELDDVDADAVLIDEMEAR